MISFQIFPSLSNLEHSNIMINNLENKNLELNLGLFTKDFWIEGKQ